MLSWFPWLVFAAVFIVLPVVLRLWAGDEPRNDEPPDSGDRDEGGAEMLAA